MSRLLCFPCFQHELLCSRLSTSGKWDQSQWQTVSSCWSCRQCNEQWDSTESSISAGHAHERSALVCWREKAPPILFHLVRLALLAGDGCSQNAAQSHTATRAHTPGGTRGSHGVLGSLRNKPFILQATAETFGFPLLVLRVAVSAYRMQRGLVLHGEAAPTGHPRGEWWLDVLSPPIWSNCSAVLFWTLLCGCILGWRSMFLLMTRTNQPRLHQRRPGNSSWLRDELPPRRPRKTCVSNLQIKRREVGAERGSSFGIAGGVRQNPNGRPGSWV